MSLIKSIILLPFTSVVALFYAIRGLVVTAVGYTIGVFAGEIASKLLAEWLEPAKYLKATGLADGTLTYKELYFWNTHIISIVVLFIVTEFLSKMYKSIKGEKTKK